MTASAHVCGASSGRWCPTPAVRVRTFRMIGRRRRWDRSAERHPRHLPVMVGTVIGGAWATAVPRRRIADPQRQRPPPTTTRMPTRSWLSRQGVPPEEPGLTGCGDAPKPPSGTADRTAYSARVSGCAGVPVRCVLGELIVVAPRRLCRGLTGSTYENERLPQRLQQQRLYPIRMHAPLGLIP